MEGPAAASTPPSSAFSAAGRPLAQPVRGQLALIGVLLALAGVAWVVTDLRMSGMDGGPGTDPGGLGFYITTWVVMMAAMMLPTLAPTAVAYRNLQHQQRGRARAEDTGLFVTGYLAVWGAAGLIGYAVLQAGRSLDGGFFAWDRAGRWTAAGVLLVAALYELTPRKRACLTRCRNPREFLTGRWHSGRAGALLLGLEHGTWCLACCWALMAALFALGAMSLVWMVLISALIAAERLLPWRSLATTGVASVLAAIAIGVAAAPTRVPALTIPGSPTAMRTMRMGPSSHTRPDRQLAAPHTRSD